MKNSSMQGMVFGAILTLTIFSVSSFVHAITREKVLVVYFHSKNCRSCREVTPYLKDVGTEHAGTLIRSYNIDETAGKALLREYERLYRVAKADQNIVPKVFVRRRYFRGAAAIRQHLVDEILSGSGVSTLTAPDMTE